MKAGEYYISYRYSDWVVAVITRSHIRPKQFERSQVQITFLKHSYSFEMILMTTSRVWPSFAARRLSNSSLTKSRLSSVSVLIFCFNLAFVSSQFPIVVLCKNSDKGETIMTFRYYTSLLKDYMFNGLHETLARGCGPAQDPARGYKRYKGYMVRVF